MKIGVFVTAGHPGSDRDYLEAVGLGAEERRLRLAVGRRARRAVRRVRVALSLRQDGRIPGAARPGSSTRSAPSRSSPRAPAASASAPASAWCRSATPLHGEKGRPRRLAVGRPPRLRRRRRLAGRGVPRGRRAVRAARRALPALPRGDEAAVVRRRVEYEGEFYTLPACRQIPSRSRSPTRRSTSAARATPRSAASPIGQGWYGFSVEPDVVPTERVATLHQVPRGAGPHVATTSRSACRRTCARSSRRCSRAITPPARSR